MVKQESLHIVFQEARVLKCREQGGYWGPCWYFLQSHMCTFSCFVRSHCGLTILTEALSMYILYCRDIRVYFQRAFKLQILVFLLNPVHMFLKALSCSSANGSRHPRGHCECNAIVLVCFFCTEEDVETPIWVGEANDRVKQLWRAGLYLSHHTHFL